MNSEKKKAAILGRRTGFERESELPMSTIDKTADELNRLHQSILTAGKNMVRFAIEAGEILFVKKNELKHGEFIPWVEENLNFKIRTVQRYIKNIRKKDLINASTLTHLEDAYKLIAGPVSEEKELNPSDNTLNPKEIYQKFKSGSRLAQREKGVLKEYLITKKEKILSNAKRQITAIDDDLNSL
nr:ParB [Escherichia coli-Leptospira shuttle vector pMaORI]